MSGVGFSELIILFLIGLIVLGPEKLPRVANQLGTWLGQARRMTRVMKRQLEEELNFDSKAQGSRPAYRPRDDDNYSPLHGADDTSGATEAERAALNAETENSAWVGSAPGTGPGAAKEDQETLPEAATEATPEPPAEESGKQA
jgi:sec-independent protein translocase protein TatB